MREGLVEKIYDNFIIFNKLFVKYHHLFIYQNLPKCKILRKQFQCKILALRKCLWFCTFGIM